MKMNVFRENLKLGTLDIQANEPFFGFTYDNEYLAQPTVLPLSLSLPLTESRYSGIQAAPYFEGLLPEGDARNIISRRLGIPRNNSVKLLQALGRDCAGDISIIDENEYPAPNSESDDNIQMYSELDGGLLSIATRPHEEISRLQEETRLSLAGAQEKIALYHNEDKPIHEGWYVPLSGSPSTHIIKPGILDSRYPHLALNEFLCLRTAAKCEINTANVDILFPENPLVIVRRYDRLYSDEKTGGLRKVTRLHQEDSCQACGINSNMKYEHDGGPGFSKVHNILATHAKRPDIEIEMFMKWGLFNYLIGNCDAHAKNISILHNMDGRVSLAPTYDIISTAVYSKTFGSKLSRSMGMKYGQHENIDRINAEDFILFARDFKIRVEEVKGIGEEIILNLPIALAAAGQEAESKGFTASEEMVRRIMVGYKQRAAVLQSV